MEWFSEKIIKKQKEKGTGKTDQMRDCHEESRETFF